MPSGASTRLRISALDYDIKIWKDSLDLTMGFPPPDSFIRCGRGSRRVRSAEVFDHGNPFVADGGIQIWEDRPPITGRMRSTAATCNPERGDPPNCGTCSNTGCPVPRVTFKGPQYAMQLRQLGGPSLARHRHGSMHVHKGRPIGLINLIQGTAAQVIVGVTLPEATVVVVVWAYIFSARD